MEVSIIIPNYNGLRFMKDCLNSLAKQTYKDYKLLIVDNGSSDGSKEYFKENNIDFIDLDTNLGFAGGCNEALKLVDTKYVILLNNDTEVFCDYVEKLVQAIKKDEKIFSVSPLMINAHKKDIVDDAGDGLCLLGFAYQIGVGEKIINYTKSKEVFTACAGAAIYRMDILREIGFFDEMHFAYLEDIDLGFRARLKGYKNVFCPSAKVYHLGSATSGSRYNSFKVKLAARNNIYLHYKNQSNIILLLNILPLSLGILIKYIFFSKMGFKNDYVEGLKEGFSTYKKCKRVDFSKVRFMDLVNIEWKMFLGTFDYIGHFLNRRFKK